MFRMIYWVTRSYWHIGLISALQTNHLYNNICEYINIFLIFLSFNFGQTQNIQIVKSP